MYLFIVALCCFLANIQCQSNSNLPDAYWKPGQFLYPEDTGSGIRTTRQGYGGNVAQVATRPAVEIEKSKDLSSSFVYEDDQRIQGGSRQQQKPNIVQQDAPSSQTIRKGLYSITDFGLNLFKAFTSNTPGNTVVSPFSIASVLALLQQGALGQTQQQISSAIGLTPSDSAEAFAAYKVATKKQESRNILRTANNVFVSDAFSLNPNFKQIAQRNFDSDITRLNFNNGDTSAREINTWVASKTNNKIDKLVSPDSLGPTTQLVLVNALYFKGIWDVPFRVQATVDRPFYLSSGLRKTVPFMRVTRYFKAGIDRFTNAKILVLPFEHDEYSMMFILPSELLGISGTLAVMKSDRLISYNALDRIETAVEIPKFSVRADTDLGTILRQLGISQIFTQDAELNALGADRSSSPHISSAVHSAVLSIDEQGGSASSSTAFAAVALSNDEPSLRFIANRPFIAVLWDNKSSLPLFMAKIEDPSIIN